ncbi:hypothetical protein FJY69_04095 [candidate division WOR-3 bacterium]|nr:hypothetical protein [candidate division WOR-3 bacterium]
MSKNETIDAVQLMRAARNKLSADMKGMTAEEHLKYIRRAVRGTRTLLPRARSGRRRPKPARV